ncbi:sensor histidine kinase [Streptomyces lavendulocolor]|uniref:sensor histidine kinase n=1 Tax=Streptomyces lavendulocolor TaxID=67316 RepID=UPI003C2F0095
MTAAPGRWPTAVADRWAAARALHPRVVDLAVALLVQVAVTLPFVVPRDPRLPEADWAAYGLTTLTVLPLVWRRRAPLAVLLAILGTSALYELALDGPGQPLPYTGLVIVYTIADLSPPRRRLGVLLMLPVVVAGSVWLNTRSVRELTFSLFVFGTAYAFGRLADTRRRANRVEAEQAAARERARIAREMHDILSHAVSLMVVQAEAGPVAVRTAPERAEAAFDAISETGRDAMAQLRRMLGVLREADDAPRSPQPGAADLPGLLERVRSSGLDVAYEVTGTARPLPPALAATVYRVVQEALTNTVRHAAARAATVELAYGEDHVRMSVTDDGRGPRGAGGGGHGLIGVRERAAAHGGGAEYGPGPGGRGFRVAVTLPLGGEAR